MVARIVWGQPPSAVQPSAARRAMTDMRKSHSTQTRPIRRALHCGLLCLAIFGLVGAGDPASRFNELGHQLMCICGCGQVLLECNHVGCPDSDRMRNELSESIVRGDNDSLILQGFVQKYGPTVLAAPTTKGFDRTAWIMPFVALVLGLGIVVLVVRAWKNRPEPVLADGLRPASAAELDQFREQARKETEL